MHIPKVTEHMEQTSPTSVECDLAYPENDEPHQRNSDSQNASIERDLHDATIESVL